MKGTMTKRAAYPLGGNIAEPPITRSMGSKILGGSIPERAWESIRTAYQLYGNRQRALEASKMSRSKGDGQSWYTRQKAAVRAIEVAMEKVEAARSRHGHFLEEASENFTSENMGHSYCSETNARKKLDEAFIKMLDAVTIVERAQAQEIETPTAATSRDILLRDMHAALANSGCNVKLSNGYDLGAMGRVRLGDLTPFEQFVVNMGLGDDKKPAAFSAWMRSALIDGEK